LTIVRKLVGSAVALRIDWLDTRAHLAKHGANDSSAHAVTRHQSWSKAVGDDVIDRDGARTME